jgi:hypothetical protein
MLQLPWAGEKVNPVPPASTCLHTLPFNKTHVVSEWSPAMSPEPEAILKTSTGWPRTWGAAGETIARFQAVILPLPISLMAKDVG